MTFLVEFDNEIERKNVEQSGQIRSNRYKIQLSGIITIQIADLCWNVCEQGRSAYRPVMNVS